VGLVLERARVVLHPVRDGRRTAPAGGRLRAPVVPVVTPAAVADLAADLERRARDLHEEACIVGASTEASAWAAGARLAGRAAGLREAAYLLRQAQRAALEGEP
jgi:hypothetical protein